MRVVLLRLDAPLMSFGNATVDHHNRTDTLPGRSMLAGLMANALGYERRDEASLQQLQSRIRHAARADRRGSQVVDFQTVDFGPAGSSASHLGWTTRGRLEERKGGDASEGTHIRLRHYLADSVVTVALTLDPVDEDPSLDRVSEALRAPRRPLFLGRKCCVPSGPVWLAELDAVSLLGALDITPRVAPVRPGKRDRADTGPLHALWPRSDDDGRVSRVVARFEDRDFANSIHTGRRLCLEGLVDPPGHAGPETSAGLGEGSLS
jgi:CRISPR system Cascade subunit CasD